jgi:hypothetical protein
MWLEAKHRQILGYDVRLSPETIEPAVDGAAAAWL